ncbi:MAG: DUF624 domain-containing protein [Clostridia bacterium]|nr:DUF624 domain-containing protein [Clostridia bacterium]
MKKRYDYNETESEPKKKKFRLFDMNRDGKGVEEEEDRTPNLKFFFKLFFRKFSKLIQLNLLMIFQVLPIIAIVLMYIYGNKTPTATDVSFAPLYGIDSLANSVGAAPLLDLVSTQMGLPVFAPIINITMIVLAVLLIVTWGWQNVGAAYVARGLYRGEPVFVWSDFFYGIKRNFKQGFLLGLIDALIMIVLAVDFVFFLSRGGTFALDFMYFVIFALVIVYMVMRFYIYLMLITFDMKITKIIKNALIFTVLGIKRNLLAILGVAILLVINGYLIVLTFPSGFSLPVVLPFIYLFASFLFITTYAAYPVIDKYMIAPYANKSEEQ